MRRPQQHGSLAQGVVVPRRPDSHRAVATLSASSASVRCPVSGVRCPVRASSCPACLSTRPVSSVRSGRLTVQVSGVRCPAFDRALCPTGVRSWRRRWGRQPHGWEGRGRRSRHRVHDRLVVCPGRNLTIEAGTSRAGQRRRRLGLSVVMGGSGSGEIDRVADQDRPDAHEDRPLVGEPGAWRGSDHASWSSWAA
jgi:hypothetical protein